jgi:hypothetical protein
MIKPPATSHRPLRLAFSYPRSSGQSVGRSLRRGSPPGDGTLDSTPNPLHGTSEVLAEELRAYAKAGVSHVQLVIDPITVESIEALAPALELLDGG